MKTSLPPNARPVRRGVSQDATARRGMFWTEAEDAFVRSSYSTLTVAEIAKGLGRGEVAVKMRARFLGVSKPRSHRTERKGR